MSSYVLVRRELARHSVGIAGITAPNVCQDVAELVPQFLVRVRGNVDRYIEVGLFQNTKYS